MSDRTGEALERSVRAACDEGRFDDATELALRGYGPELLGFLVGMLRSETRAREVWALASEDVWRGLPTFRWTSTLRAWCYTIARRALARHHRSAKRHADRFVVTDTRLSRLQQPRTTSVPTCLRTQSRRHLDRIRAELPEDLEVLLVLRVDRALSWEDIARVMYDDGREWTAAESKKLTAALRKRFERLVAKLRKRMQNVA